MGTISRNANSSPTRSPLNPSRNIYHSRSGQTGGHILHRNAWILAGLRSLNMARECHRSSDTIRVPARLRAQH
jgi:hypothetical protein